MRAGKTMGTVVLLDPDTSNIVGGKVRELTGP